MSNGSNLFHMASQFCRVEHKVRQGFVSGNVSKNMRATLLECIYCILQLSR